MTSSFEKSVTYLVLVVASVMALFPLGSSWRRRSSPTRSVPPAASALRELLRGLEARQLQHLPDQQRDRVGLRGRAAARCSRAWPATPSGRWSSAGSYVLFYLLLLGLMVPSEAVVIPLYYDLRDLHLTDTYVSLVFPQIAQSLAFGTFWMRAYFRSTSREIVEAARLDGAGHGRVLLVDPRPDGPAGGLHHGGAHLHVDLERVPAPAGDDQQRVAAHRAARALGSSRGSTRPAPRCCRPALSWCALPGPGGLPAHPTTVHQGDGRGLGQGLTHPHHSRHTHPTQRR